MEFFKRLVNRISGHFLVRNLVLAICGVVVFLFVVTILLNLFTRHGQSYSVPDLVGMTIDQTGSLIKDASLELVVNDSLYIAGTAPGTILDQFPRKGSQVKSGRKIFLVINSTMPKSEVIPYVAGYSLRQAKNTIESKGFEIAKLIYQPDMATNNVLSQSYNGTPISRGSTLTAPLGSGVTLIVGVSGSSALPMVPKVVGLTLKEAKSRLWEVGLNVGAIERDKGLDKMNEAQARIYKQSPGQQSRVSYGSNVTLYLTNETSKVNSGSRSGDQQASQVVEPESEELTDEQMDDLLQ